MVEDLQSTQGVSVGAPAVNCLQSAATGTVLTATRT